LGNSRKPRSIPVLLQVNDIVKNLSQSKKSASTTASDSVAGGEKSHLDELESSKADAEKAGDQTSDYPLFSALIPNLISKDNCSLAL
jgi:hypothetical protein